MEFMSYLVVLGRRKVVVIVTVLVTVLVVSIGTLMMTPTYTATSTLRITTASATSYSSDYLSADRIINTNINILTSRPFLDELNKQLGLTEPPKIEVSQIPNSELIQILVQDNDPQLAMQAANILGDLLIAQTGEFYKGNGKTPADVLKEQVDQVNADLEQMKSDYVLRVARYPDDTAGNQAAFTAVESQEQLYYSLLSQYQQLLIRQAIQANNISFVEKAALPGVPSSPNKVLNIALGFLVGLIGGVGLAFLIENLDTTMFTSDDIVVITQLAPIGRIPITRSRAQRKLPLDGNTAYGDSFYRLRTNLLTKVVDTPIRSLMMTSATQGEGKSTVISSLAFALSQSGKKVLLIDADIRLPTLHKIFDLQNKTGLCNYLTEEKTLRETIIETTFPGLHVIPAGQCEKKPISMLDSSAMRDLVPTLLKAYNYDYFLIDSPAILAVTDASMIAPLVDSVLLVVKPGLIQKGKLTSALEQLLHVKAKIMGLVINGEKSLNYSYSYYQRKGSDSKRGG